MSRLSKPSLVVAAASLVLLAAACGDAGDNRHTNHWLTELTDATHTTYFPIDSGGHKGMACNLCHGSYDSFKGFSCIGCHAHSKSVTDAQHPHAPGYTYTAQSCYLCHANGTVRFDLKTHQYFFPIGGTTPHSKVACSMCHTDATRLGEVAYITCAGKCHSGAHKKATTDPFHFKPLDGGGPVGKIYQWAPAACIQCHIDGRMLMRPTHTPTKYNGHNVAQGPHNPISCASCHLSRNFKAFTCAPCHNPGGSAYSATAACDTAKGSSCTDLQKYHYFYK